MNAASTCKWLISTIVILSALTTGNCAIAKVGHKSEKSCAAEDQERQQAAIKAACSETVNRYPYLRDQLKYVEYGELFTQDANFQIGEGPKVSGRTAIVDALRKRGPLATTRHFNQIVSMEFIDSKTIRAISYVNVHSGKPNQSPQANGAAVHPWVVGEYHDILKVVDDRCLITDRKVKIIFQRER